MKGKDKDAIVRWITLKRGGKTLRVPIKLSKWGKGGKRRTASWRKQFEKFDKKFRPKDYDKRLGQCYVLAARKISYMMRKEAKNAQLIHGTISTPFTKKLSHAWLEKYVLKKGKLQVRIWEPSYDIWLDEGVFIELFNPGDKYWSYTQKEVNNLMFKHETYGPWEKK